MSNIGKPLALGALALLAGGALLYSPRGGTLSPVRSRSQPYWQRTGFLSKFLQDLKPAAGGLDSIQVPEGFEVQIVAGPDLVNYPMFIAYDDRGRLFVCESAGKNLPDDEMQAKRQSQTLFRRLGEAYYAQERQGGSAEAVASALTALDQHVVAQADKKTQADAGAATSGPVPAPTADATLTDNQ